MAIKKTSKSPQSTPAKKTAAPKSGAVKPVAAKAAVKKTVAAKKPAALSRKPEAPAPIATPVAATAPAVKRTAAISTLTVITATVDVGFGNTLYLRGDGPGLSWDKGIPLACVSAERWTLTIGETSKPVSFKFLLNDVIWSEGEDYVAAPGSAIVLKPAF